MTRKQPATATLHMISSDILNLLKARHADEFCVEECKDGPTQFVAGHMRLDLWCFRRSWSQPCMTGYEIKVSRSDFLRDDKWQGYLPLCNTLYFAAPPGLIGINELPPEVGLIEATKNARRMIVKKKAPFRIIEEPNMLFRYIIMCRSTPQRDYHFDVASYWRNWMQERADKADLGRAVGKRISQLIKQRIAEVECENKRLEQENRNLEEVKDLCAELGVRPGTWRVKNLLIEAQKGVTMDDVKAIESALSALTRAKEILSPKEEIAACDGNRGPA